VIPVLTIPEVPGRVVAEVLGSVVAVEPRNRAPSVARSMMDSLRGRADDDDVARQLADAREKVVARLAGKAEALGADAVVGARFDSVDAGELYVELCVYGTAVVTRPAG
jgi:uncharacterized protein YbjQ (UPF0145 family)